MRRISVVRPARLLKMGFTEYWLSTLVTVLLCTLCCRGQTLKYEVVEEKSKGTFVANISQTEVPQKFKAVFAGTLRYKLQDVWTRQAFQIDEHTGILRTNRVLDRENISLSEDTFQLQIACSVGIISALIPAEVKLLDINDNNPKFAQAIEEISISESAALNVELGIAGAEDIDIGNNSVQGYEITERNDDGVFGLKVKHPSPEITRVFLVVLKKLDREKNDSYSLTIQAKDGGNPPRVGAKKLNISILDSNDNNPKFSKDLYVGEVEENEAAGAFIVNVSATDLDLGTNAEIEYFLEQRSAYNGLFKLDSVTGELRTNAELDFEKRSEYQLEVTAKDRGPDAIKSTAIVKVKVRVSVVQYS